ncbi:hypothetical protein F7Q92_03070 [Ideonella dechloratans]|uniref:Uncharacterized protein n=1 Tax=Ideonella dechloratans TaxID=36863 RepID=A0A643FFE6_IDEDE|nr:hypothetical protein [Ideonella dechloratans]KAB0584508.1 hypothetical protein F7Q92_03070 [Ideonella dechloratans]UFU10215.1 hypothetical protein LRM40_00395 [Ideonella dechloratans]
MTAIRTFPLPALLLAVAATAAANDQVAYSGDYFYNFEFAYLTPDGKNEQWCIKGDMAPAERADRWGTSRVVVEGTLGPEGKYGNLGVCKRILTVTRLLKVINMRGRE